MTRGYVDDMANETNLSSALAALVGFLRAAPLTESIKDLEHALVDASANTIDGIVEAHGISPAVLEAAMVARATFGRLNDVIHAAGVTLALPRLLKPDETLKRPSLAAGNDKSRPFDVETNRRAMEFKFGRWDGHDAMRKRGVAKDLVHLAELADGRRAELYVLGNRPTRFLTGSKASMGWALDRAPATRARFASQFGPLEQTVAEFYESVRERVSVIDLELLLPDLFPPAALPG